MNAVDKRRLHVGTVQDTQPSKICIPRECCQWSYSNRKEVRTILYYFVRAKVLRMDKVAQVESATPAHRGGERPVKASLVGSPFFLMRHSFRSGFQLDI
jgi:hypothetical protein